MLYKIDSDAAYLVCPEAKVAGLFMNAQHAVPIRLTLEDTEHKQPPTPLRTDNKTAQGILSGVYKKKIKK